MKASPLDVTDPIGIRAFATRLAEERPSLNVLINYDETFEGLDAAVTAAASARNR